MCGVAVTSTGEERGRMSLNGPQDSQDGTQVRLNGYPHYRDNGDIVLRERPYEPRLAKAAAKKSKTSQSTRPGKKS